MNRWNVLMRVFVAEYLGLKPAETKAREDQDHNRDELVSPFMAFASLVQYIDLDANTSLAGLVELK